MTEKKKQSYSDPLPPRRPPQGGSGGDPSPRPNHPFNYSLSLRRRQKLLPGKARSDLAAAGRRSLRRAPTSRGSSVWRGRRGVTPARVTSSSAVAGDGGGGCACGSLPLASLEPATPRCVGARCFGGVGDLLVSVGGPAEVLCEARGGGARPLPGRRACRPRIWLRSDWGRAGHVGSCRIWPAVDRIRSCVAAGLQWPFSVAMCRGQCSTTCQCF